MSNAKKLIKSHGLRLTEQRLAIVELMTEKNQAVCYKDLSDNLPDTFDRVTIYRNLKAFETKGLIHAIPNAEGDLYYALCNHDHDEHSHGTHAHFRCMSCNKIECLNETEISSTKLPAGYSASSYRLVIQGTCNKCNI